MPLAAILGMLATASYGPWQTKGQYWHLPLQVCWGHWCCSSDQGVPTLRQDEGEAAHIDDMPEEHPCRKQKEGRLVGKALKEPWREAFSKESDVMMAARMAHQKAH